MRLEGELGRLYDKKWSKHRNLFHKNKDVTEMDRDSYSLHNDICSTINKHIRYMHPEKWSCFNWQDFIDRRISDHGKGIRILLRVVKGNSRLTTISESIPPEELNQKLRA